MTSPDFFVKGPFEHLVVGSSAEGALPPPILFKYLPPERVDVFENCMVSFTPPTKFNDVLEFSVGAEQFLGSRFQQALFQRMHETLTPELLADEAIRRGAVPPIANRDFLLQWIKPQMPLIQRWAARVMQINAPNHLELLNSLPLGRLFLDGATSAGVGVLCLTDDPHSPVMWSHYAKDYTGFVLALDAFHPWFWYDTGFERPRVFQVIYDDVIVPEFMEIIDGKTMPLLRKRTSWAHEHEWRMFESVKNQSRYDEEHDISLFSVPKEAILGVLMGHQMPSEASQRIIIHKVLHAPEAQLRVVKPDCLAGVLQSVTLEPD